MQDYMFRIDFKVRDYEVDMEGVVNHAVYLHYLEHARHEFLLSRGIDFADYTARGIYMFIIRAEVDYKMSLRSGDKFWVGVNSFRESRVKMGFQQDIYRYPDNKLMVQAKLFGTGLSESGRPKLPEEVIERLGIHE